MSVIAQLAIQQFFFPGYEDPSLPSGIWKGSQIVTGDASGGFMEVDLLMSPIGPLNTRFYSIDQFSAFQTGATAIAAHFIIINLGQLTDRRYDLPLVLSGDQTNVDPLGSQFAFLPLFLGSQVNAAASALVAFVCQNGDTEILTFNAMGYFWQARAGNAPGGPSRPVQGVFSR